MKKNKKKQLLLYPSDTLIKQIDDAVKALNISRTRNSVLVEILETYMPKWIEAERAKRAVIAKQTAGDTKNNPAISVI